MSIRYALNIMPDVRSQLWQFGSRILGYDAFYGQSCVYLKPSNISLMDWQILTQEQNIHGFHGNLKPSFRLSPQRNEKEFFAAIKEFSKEQIPFVLPALRVVNFQNRLVLQTVRQSVHLDNLMTKCEAVFESFISPQQSLEKRTTYDFNFPLLGSFQNDSQMNYVQDYLTQKFNLMREEVIQIHTVTLYVQARKDTRFRALKSFRLGEETKITHPAIIAYAPRKSPSKILLLA